MLSEKIQSDQKIFNIHKTDPANLYFLIVESMGAYGKAIKLCKFLAEFGDELLFSEPSKNLSKTISGDYSKYWMPGET
jgi:hypothetical protein